MGAAFLAVVQAELSVTAAAADVERRTVLARAARTLADNELRPGAEASRAEALVLAQTHLARVLGVTAGRVGVNGAGVLLTRPPASALTNAPAAHPVAQARQSSVEQARVQQDVLARTNRPRLFLQSALFTRGSGAAFDGSLEGGAEGLWPDRPNWAAGMHVVFPNLFEFSSLRARREASAATTRMRRPAPATRPAWPASSKWPTRRACWRRPNTRTPWPASMCGGRCWPMRSRTAT